MNSLALSVPLTCFTILGLIFNGYVVLVVILTRQTTTANNILLLHLGVIDLLLGIVFLIFAAPGITKGGWLSSGAPCAIHGFLFTLLHPLTLWTICGLNCDRYYAIASPLHYSHVVNPKKVLFGLGAGWIVSLALCIPPFFSIAPYSYSPGLGACTPDFSYERGALWYSVVYTAFTLLLPATLIICCNLKILMIARYHRHRIASAIYEVTLSAQVTITHQRNPFFVPIVTAPAAGGPKFRGKSAVSSVLQLVCSFVILYVPYYTASLWEALETVPRVPPTLSAIAQAALICSPPVNGFLYGLRNRTLRKTFQNYWRKKVMKSEMNQEIQARTPSTCGSRRPSITPLGFLSKPTLHRRLSEAFLDVHRMVSPQRPKIKRIASELPWRPNSTPGLNQLPSPEEKHPKISHTSSCNTLQVPREEHEESNVKPTRPHNFNTSFFQKVFGESGRKYSHGLDAPDISPRILITRAFSEESEKASNPTSPARDFTKKLSASTTLLEKKWRQLRGKDDDDDLEESSLRLTTKPLISSGDDTSYSNRSSDSSDGSDISSGRLYMGERLKEHKMPEEQLLLLPWEHPKRPRELMRHHSLANAHNEEVVL